MLAVAVLEKAEKMAEAFHIVSVDRSLTNWGHRHITALGTAPKPGFPDHWSIASVLSMIGAGELFYTMSVLGSPAFAHPYRCWCGVETIRTTANDKADDGFEGLSKDQSGDERFAPTPS